MSALIIYLSLYTWNTRTGYLDTLTQKIGLESAGHLLKPGDYVIKPVMLFWHRYISLVGVREENERLRREVERLTKLASVLREEAAEVGRLRKLLDFAPPTEYEVKGARVLAGRFGPKAVLNTIIIDLGLKDGITRDTAVVNHHGVIGRVLQVSSNYSTVLLLNDPNSRISVIGQSSRNPGIMAGQGVGNPLNGLYVHMNKPMTEGELLVTSGMDELYPKGLPVARITRAAKSGLTQFQNVSAEPLADLIGIEEVILLRKKETSEEKNADTVKPDSAEKKPAEEKKPAPEEKPKSGNKTKPRGN